MLGTQGVFYIYVDIDKKVDHLEKSDNYERMNTFLLKAKIFIKKNEHYLK